MLNAQPCPPAPLTHRLPSVSSTGSIFKRLQNCNIYNASSHREHMVDYWALGAGDHGIKIKSNLLSITNMLVSYTGLDVIIKSSLPFDSSICSLFQFTCERYPPPPPPPHRLLVIFVCLLCGAEDADACVVPPPPFR